MLVTLSGMVMEVRLMQLAKALYPMLVMLSGMLIAVRLVQPQNASALILVTVSGIMTFSSPSLAKNAFSPIVVITGGRIRTFGTQHCFKTPFSILRNLCIITVLKIEN